MSPLVLLLAASLPAVPPESARPLPLRLERGQEFVYQARHTQESDRPGSRTSCSVVTHVLILDHGPQGTLAAFMTAQHFDGPPGSGSVPAARLEMGRIDSVGRVSLVDCVTAVPRIPIDGAPSMETLPFVDLPHVEPGRTWEVADRELGPQTWRVLVTAAHKHGQCLKLKGEQSSAGKAAGGLIWNREEIAWILQYDGSVVRSERMTRWQTESGETFKATTVTDLIDQPGSMPPQQFADRRAEINEARQFARELAELMKPRGEPNLRGYDDLLRAMDRRRELGTPYTAAITSLRRRAEMARRGERPPEAIVIAPRVEVRSSPRDVGEAAPELAVPPVGVGASISLDSLRGRPAVLVFFKPSSRLTAHVLGYVRDASRTHGERVAVVSLACEGNSAAFPKDFKFDLPVHDGRAALSAFAGASTPRIVVLDGKGVIRVIAPGWGGEYGDWLHKELTTIMQEK